MPPLEVMSGLLSKLVIWSSGDLRLPHLLGAAAAKDSVTQEGGHLPRNGGRLGSHSCCTRFRCLGNFGRGAVIRGELWFFSSLANCLVPFSSGRPSHANHLWVDPRVK